MPRKDDNSRMDALLAQVTEDMLGSDLPYLVRDDSLRVERILLDLVRPDPIQPRRILPSEVHHAFHNHRLTPTQALRELVQLAQVSARQQGRPFSNVLELLPNADEERDDQDMKLSPEEQLLRDLVNLAITIRDDGQVNPLSVVDVSQGVASQFRIETGERRYWATWLLRDFIPDYQGDGMIPCIIIPQQQSSVFRQAKENTARSGLTAIAMARQAALLLLTVHGYEIPDCAVSNDFYRQALELRLPRGAAQQVYSAMGGMTKMQFSRYKDLMNLCDEAMELADRHQIDEGKLRLLLSLSGEDQVEMLHQIIRLGLTVKQIEDVIANATSETEETSEVEVPRPIRKLALLAIKHIDGLSPELLWKATVVETGDSDIAVLYLKRLSDLANAAAKVTVERK